MPNDRPIGDDRHAPGMPSTLVHVAVGGLVAAGILGDAFDRRSLIVVLAFAAFPDLDTFVGLVVPGAHRSLFHTLLVPAILGGLLWVDARVEYSTLGETFGGRGRRVVGVGVLALMFGGIAPDLVTNGVNWLYPILDQFVAVNGHLLLSNQRGVVQTFVHLSGPDAGGAVVGTTETLHYSTGVDPTPGPERRVVERVFPVVDSGMQLLLVVLSAFVVGARLRETKR
ncbi:MAG: metal-dependent hydrolase [Halanaeroarchaeum sp.]